MNKLEKKKVFDELSISMNIVNDDVVRRAYYGFIGYIVDNTKKGIPTVLPDFGVFKLSSIKSRLSNMPNERVQKVVPSSKTIRFKAIEKVRKFINKD